MYWNLKQRTENRCINLENDSSSISSSSSETTSIATIDDSTSESSTEEWKQVVAISTQKNKTIRTTNSDLNSIKYQWMYSSQFVFFFSSLLSPSPLKSQCYYISKKNIIFISGCIFFQHSYLSRDANQLSRALQGMFKLDLKQTQT